MTDKKIRGSEDFACGWQNYTADGWAYPYHQSADDPITIKIDKDGQSYIRFILCTPRLFGSKYYFFPVVMHGDSLCTAIKRIIKFGDFIQVVGYWHQNKVALASYNGKTRLRDWNHIIATRINIMPHVRNRQEIAKFKNIRNDRGMARTFTEIRGPVEEIKNENDPNPFSSLYKP